MRQRVIRHSADGLPQLRAQARISLSSGEALAYAQEPDPEAFTVLTLQLYQLAVLHLGPVHRRAVLLRGDHWGGGLDGVLTEPYPDTSISQVQRSRSP